MNKKTFYRYYSNLDALLQETLEKFSREYLKRIAHLNVPADLTAINREFFHYSEEKGPLYEKLVCEVSLAHMGGEMLSEFVRRCWRRSAWFQNLSKERQNVLCAFLHSVGGALYRQWVADGKRLSLDEMVELSGELLCHGVQGFMRACGGDEILPESE